MSMQLTDVFLNLGEDQFSKLVRSISLGKLKTYQLYERFKLRTHISKLNTENLRKATPRLWQRLSERNDEYATDLSQAVLISHLDMIVAVLNFLGIPHEDGFFVKDLDATPYLTEGWRERTYEKFHTEFPEAVVLFYINHLSLEMGKTEDSFLPAAK
jgi:hypothetical protein